MTSDHCNLDEIIFVTGDHLKENAGQNEQQHASKGRQFIIHGGEWANGLKCIEVCGARDFFAKWGSLTVR